MNSGVHGHAYGAYITSTEKNAGKSTIALGTVHLLSSTGASVGVFRPIAPVQSPDTLLRLLTEYAATSEPDADCTGVTLEQYVQDPDSALSIILNKYNSLRQRCDWVVILGTDYEHIHSPSELDLNAELASHLGVPLVVCLNGTGRSLSDIAELVAGATATVVSKHASLANIIINQVSAEQLPVLQNKYEAQSPPVLVLPNEPLLSAPTLLELATAAKAKIYNGYPDALSQEFLHFYLAGGPAHTVVNKVQNRTIIVVPPGRDDVLLAILAARSSAASPVVSGIIVCEDYTPSAEVDSIIKQTECDIPIVITPLDLLAVARIIHTTVGSVATGSFVKFTKAIELVEHYALTDTMISNIQSAVSDVVTPKMFEYQLMQKARSRLKHIVLPEGEELRILTAAQKITSRKVATITLLGKADTVRDKASELGVSLDGIDIIDPEESSLREEFAREYQKLREHKGVTYSEAYDKMADVSYFGTMLVHTNRADGMVSGAMHTTAHTIRPAFEIIKTKPDISTVSSVFFMCLADRVLTFGDCAVVPDPTVEQLADIAISSAHTAEQFGLEARVALLSYSTGSSGAGVDVESVRRATQLVHEREPELLCDGPIQYDAAVDPGVAAQKLPGSPVAGRATVLIFPDLNAGNNTYKAVQRSAGAVAIGPVLQGINKPINDLSRGALVEDIVNTIAITAIQAQYS